MKLYHAARSAARSRSTRPRWMLEEIGAPYDLVRLDMQQGEHKAFQRSWADWGQVVGCYVARLWVVWKPIVFRNKMRRGVDMRWGGGSPNSAGN